MSDDINIRVRFDDREAMQRLKSFIREAKKSGDSSVRSAVGGEGGSGSGSGSASVALGTFAGQMIQRTMDSIAARIPTMMDPTQTQFQKDRAVRGSALQIGGATVGGLLGSFGGPAGIAAGAGIGASLGGMAEGLFQGGEKKEEFLNQFMKQQLGAEYSRRAQLNVGAPSDSEVKILTDEIRKLGERLFEAQVASTKATDNAMGSAKGGSFGLFLALMNDAHSLNFDAMKSRLGREMVRGTSE
ncbi:MAG: hypothetical protein AB7F99_09520 [Vicinamibacterales bacterium]